MNIDQVDHLADHLVLPGLASVVARGRSNDAETLAFIAVADERKLYLAAAYPSMYQYCIGELHMSEDAAAKRIQAARSARQFPAIFDAVAQGRLNLSGLVLLAPYLTAGTAEELLAASTHRTNARIRLLLAERFPQPDLLTRVQAIEPAGPERQHAVQHAPTPAGQHAAQHVPAPGSEHALRHVAVPACSPAPAQDESPAPRPRLAPLAPQRFSWQLTVSGSTNDKLKYARELLGHAVPKGEVADVLDRALDSLIEKLERHIFAAGPRKRPGRGSEAPRHVPAAVKHEVWVRDGGRCTFVSDKGHRCESRTRLELDHVDPVARGGKSTALNTRLLCRAHNRHAAECAFGKGFMREKREAARHQRQQARRRGEAPGLLPTAALEVVPRLRKLGISPDEARRAAARAAAALPDAPLEERVGYAVTLTAHASAHGEIPVASPPG